MQLGIQGPYGFIPYPGAVECGEGFDAWAEKILHTARAQEMAVIRNAAYGSATAQTTEGTVSAVEIDEARRAIHALQAETASVNRAPTLMTAQMLRAPGKMFSRETILAIICAERTKWHDDGTETCGIRYRAAMEALDAVQHIFKKLETP